MMENSKLVAGGAVTVQLYPRSILDTNGDGIGDLRGIIKRLEYYAYLGIKRIWLSPIFESPFIDGGYDVSDYYRVHPMFGTLGDVRELVERAGEYGIDILLDLVISHCSDQHRWFQDVLANPDSPYADYFVVEPPRADGSMPSNHLSIFGGEAWRELEDGRWVYHTFDRTQIDWNYDHPGVLEMMKDVVWFWFDLGIKGLRVDAAPYAGKSRQQLVADAPENPDWDGQEERKRLLHPVLTEGTLRVVAALNAVARKFKGRVLLYEAYPDEVLSPAAHAQVAWPFFSDVSTAIAFVLHFSDWTAAAVGGALQEYLSALPEGAVPMFEVGNHDQPRPASRYGHEQMFVAHALTLGALPGVPCIYYGDELGMRNAVPSGRKEDPSQVGFDRDAARGPMIWDGDQPHGGFCDPQATPWTTGQPADYPRSAAAQQGDPGSLLEWVGGLTALRRAHPELAGPDIEFVHSDNPGVLIIARRLDDGSRLLFLLNFTGEEQVVSLPEYHREVALSHHLGRVVQGEGPVRLRPNEALVLRLTDHI